MIKEMRAHGRQWLSFMKIIESAHGYKAIRYRDVGLKPAIMTLSSTHNSLELL